jgi:hypothetical protein
MCQLRPVYRSLERVAGAAKLNAGAFVVFAAPDLPAPDAPIIWIPKQNQPPIIVRADRHCFNQECDFDACNLKFAVHVHFSAEGIQNVVLKSPSFHIALIVNGPLVTMGPLRLHFATTTIASLHAHLDGLSALAHMLLQRRFVGAMDRPADLDRIHLRNAIIANDGERAGASRREIAAVIHGSEIVASEWNDPRGRLKAVIKRDILRGRRLVGGGWREMVARGTFRAMA